jgi:oligopeptidase A
MNPLLDFSGLPRFAEFKPESVAPALDQLLTENRALVEILRNQDTPPDWESFIAPLDDGNERLRRTWGQVSHMNAVMNSPQLRDVYNANIARITQYFTELAQDEALYRKYKALRASDAFSRLTDAQKKVIENELRDFRLGGAELAPIEKTRSGSSRYWRSLPGCRRGSTTTCLMLPMPSS